MDSRRRLASRSPVDGLDRRSVAPVDVLAQSVGAVAPAAAAVTSPLLVAGVAGRAAVASFAVALVLALLVASCVAQFARRVAATGSLYTYVANALGARAAVVAGVGLLAAYGAIAAASFLGAGSFAALLAGRLGVAAPRLVGVVVVAAVAVAVCVALLRGIRRSTRLALVVEAVSVALIATLVVLLLVRSGGAAVARAIPPGDDLEGVVPGAVLALTAFAGFESATTLGAEARRPFAAVPRAVRWSAAVAGTLFLLAVTGQVAGFEVLGSTLATSSAPVDDLTAGFAVPWLAPVLDVGVVASFLACAVASTTALTRVLFSMAREGLAPTALGRVDPVRRSPARAVVLAVPVLAVPALVVLAASDEPWHAFETMLVVAGAGCLVAYTLACAGVWPFLRRVGEVTVVPVAVSCLATVLLGAALVAFLTTETAHAHDVGVLVFGGVMVAGVVASRVRLRRLPAVRARLGVHDEPTAADVLPGTAKVLDETGTGAGTAAASAPVPLSGRGRSR